MQRRIGWPCSARAHGQQRQYNRAQPLDLPHARLLRAEVVLCQRVALEAVQRIARGDGDCMTSRMDGQQGVNGPQRIAQHPARQEPAVVGHSTTVPSSRHLTATHQCAAVSSTVASIKKSKVRLPLTGEGQAVVGVALVHDAVVYEQLGVGLRGSSGLLEGNLQRVANTRSAGSIWAAWRWVNTQ